MYHVDDAIFRREYVPGEKNHALNFEAFFSLGNLNCVSFKVRKEIYIAEKEYDTGSSIV